MRLLPSFIPRSEGEIAALASFHLASSAGACSVTSNNKQPRALRRIALRIARRLLVWQVPSLKRGRFSSEGRLIAKRNTTAVGDFPQRLSDFVAEHRLQVSGLRASEFRANSRAGGGQLNWTERGICAPKIRGREKIKCHGTPFRAVLEGPLPAGENYRRGASEAAAERRLGITLISFARSNLLRRRIFRRIRRALPRGPLSLYLYLYLSVSLVQ